MYNVADRTVVVEFMDNGGWLEEGDEEFRITSKGVERNITI